ncbi:MAG TPA: hypothetical protein VKP89_03045 [Burkholderiales bacterium]|nr:hypothetical protein [Burkholderiales bacterium]
MSTQRLGGGVEQRGSHRHEERLAGDAGPRAARLLEHRVADDDEAQAVQHLFAPPPEQLTPAEAADQLDQGRLAERHDDTALVEDGQQVAQRAALAALARDLGRVPGVQRRLDARK